MSTGQPVRRRLLATSVVGITATLLASCGSGQAAPIRHHRSTTTTTTVAPTTSTTTTTVPSAVPTTVPAPVVPTPGWSSPATVLAPAGGVTGLSCLSDVLCVAVGGGVNHADSADTSGAGVALSWDGVIWSPPSVWFPAPSSGTVTAPFRPAVACASGPLCLIVDGSGHTSYGDGTAWTTPAPLAQPQQVPTSSQPDPGQPGGRTAAVSCTPGRFCALADNLGHVAVLRGGRWSQPRTLTTPFGGIGATGTSLVQTGRVGVACSGPANCTAFIGTGVATWDGGRWSTTPSPFGASGVKGDTAVACPTTNLCVAVHGPYVTIGNGATWSPPRYIDGIGSLDAISCPTATFCLAADDSGDVVTWDGSTWSSPRRVVPYPTNYTTDGTSASCPSAQFCLVINGDGDYATFQGEGPLTTPTTLPPTVGLPSSAG